jgi:hypothetical protein
MKQAFDRRRLLAVLLSLAFTACSREAAPPPLRAAPPVHARSYQYAGSGGSSHVTRETAANGHETLSGTTELGAGASSSPRTRLNETALLDERGRLLHAEIVSSRPGTSDVRFVLDALRGTVRIEHDGSVSVEWRVPVDVPWLYAPTSSAGGELAVTPVAAWIALRAASTAGVVRVLEPEHQESNLVTIDQVVVATERGTTVALGYDGVDIDQRFITEVRLVQRSVTLSRVAEFDLGA